jgi:hypothetical protein
MPIVKQSAQVLRRDARVDRKKMAATSEKDIARYAREEETKTDDVDFGAAVRSGRVRVVRPRSTK